MLLPSGCELNKKAEGQQPGTVAKVCKPLGQLIFPQHIFLWAAHTQTSPKSNSSSKISTAHPCDVFMLFSPQSSGGKCRTDDCTDKYSTQLLATSGQGQGYLNFYRHRTQREKCTSHLGAQDQSHVNISALGRTGRRRAEAAQNIPMNMTRLMQWMLKFENPTCRLCFDLLVTNILFTFVFLPFERALALSVVRCRIIQYDEIARETGLCLSAVIIPLFCSAVCHLSS